MKKRIITATVCLLIVTSAFSQMKRIDSMLVNIDKTNFTNILYERTTPWSKLAIFNDSINISTKRHFEQALHELYKSSNQEKFTYYRDLRTQYTSKSVKNTVDIGIINTTFNALNYSEIDETKGALRIKNNKFERTKSKKPAFLEKHALVVAPLKEQLTGKNITYKFDNQFIFQETKKTIRTLTANFNTSQNYTIIKNGILVKKKITVNYATEGLKQLIFTATFANGATLETKAMVKTSVLRSPPPLVENPPNQIATLPFQGALGEVEYRIFYHTKNNDGSTNSQKRLLKPIVIIDGFDPGDERKIGYLNDDVTENTLVNQMYYQDANDETKNLVKKLREKGYDVIIVNQITHTKNNVVIDGGADYIERNALAHVALYQHLNTTVLQNGSSEDLVIMGPSMGGQISRYALAYMEKHNIAHNTRLWVSVDSPHLGANIPLGMQAMMNLLDAFGDSTAAADFYNDRLKSVAGNQQIIEQHLPYHLSTHLNNGSPVRQQYLSNLTSNGLVGSNGYPQNLRKIAMVNGNTMGINVGVAGTEDFRIHGFVNQLWWKVKVVEMNTKYMPNSGQSKQIARLWRRFKPTRTATYTNINPNGSLDIVPGGLFDTENQLHSAVMNDGVGISNWGNGINIQEVLLAGFFGIWGDYFSSRTNKEIHSFVPTVSALGFKNSNFNWSNNINRNLVCSNEIPFDNYYSPRNNSQHVSFTQESIEWLFKELDINTQNPSPTVYITSSDLRGATTICSTANKTYSFDDCKLGSTPIWQVSPNLQIVSSTNSSVTVRAINSAISGSASVKAFVDDQSVYKRIWIGKPKISTRLNPTSNYVYVDLIGANNTSIRNQGITSTTWKKISSSGQCYAAFSGSGFKGFGHGNCNNWSLRVKITARNSCGTTTIYRTIVPPPTAPCDDNFRFSQNPMKSGNSMNKILIDPCEDNYRKSSKSKPGNYTIDIYNNYGKKIDTKTQREIEFDISKLKKGFYFVKFEAKNGNIITKKLIIN
ncbi:T9SS type A sorting domain-containing protein [Polaribacter sp.]|nr:T9SS type A sorting domain-containing protein [Polaribacter sp.]